MCNFLSVIILRDGSVVHDEENSHSKAVELAGIKEPNQFQVRRFWEWEWDGVGEFKLEKYLRGYDAETPEVVVKTALRLAERLPLALEEGKFLDTEFKNMPLVKIRSKNWEGCITWKNGRQDWWKNGGRHREDGPAVVYPSGRQEWWKDGKLHREDGPAVVYFNGVQQRWYRHGKLHREDGPAVINLDGSKEWYRGGKLHREDGPAAVYLDGIQEWWKDGKLHREDGPAIVYPSGTKEWWKDGEQYYPQKGTACVISCH
jgi:hypothetical protein